MKTNARLGERAPTERALLLLDIGNTNTHLGFAHDSKVTKQRNIPTRSWFEGHAPALLATFLRGHKVTGASFCSVVPKASPRCVEALTKLGLNYIELTCETIVEVGIDYPKPSTIGADRLANAVAVKHHFGAPSVVVDFGTAVTFDVVNVAGNYAGGIIAPGLSAMTDYLHEKTALLPKITIREIDEMIGKSTEQAMLIGAVHGYRGLVRELLIGLKKELKTRKLPVVATGGYGALIAAKMPEITAVDPMITLEGLRLVGTARLPVSK